MMSNETATPETATDPAGRAISDLLVSELERERLRQIAKGFGPEWDDHNKGFDEWCNDINAYNTWARQMAAMRSPAKYRRRMMQIAVLAIAACESFDRVCGGPGEEDGPWADGWNERRSGN